MRQLVASCIKAAGRTDVGCVRTLNEDNFWIDEMSGLLLVADGMGGHDAGEVASSHVVESMLDMLKQPMPGNAENKGEYGDQEDDGEIVTLSPDEVAEELASEMEQQEKKIVQKVQRAIAQTNLLVNNINQDRGYPEGSGMGSTLVGFWAPPGSMRGVVFHVGDSRLYLMRQGQLKSVTQDHTLYQQWLDFGSKGQPPAQNVILQAMGPVEQVMPDVQTLDLQPKDLILMCSDGLTGMLADATLAKILSTANEKNLQEVCNRLVDMAKEKGGKDNITVILAWISKP
ncbi:MAG: serine/threonine-protein phosphatase [Magnetococcales bacterium]|nr:serine/threonine-protein phosphatase [Magnetococcales bacterium]MBF0321854.1 serine/threonine-protein phosphatase [Magnetococcales bacterium]MBF0321857.1 serine/threonine-protein phosphatase [Magnetococcales bacterium]